MGTQLYDRYGFYVIDESDIEMHGVLDVYATTPGMEHNYMDYLVKITATARCATTSALRPLFWTACSAMWNATRTAPAC